MVANVGDYIIKGVNGEFYPCKPDIFEKTYEAVNQNITNGADATADADGTTTNDDVKERANEFWTGN